MGFLLVIAVLSGLGSTCGRKGNDTAASDPPERIGQSGGRLTVRSNAPARAISPGPQATLLTASDTASPRPRTRLIEMGWDEPDTRFMRANLPAMERTPFEGCVFHVMYPRPGGKQGNFTWEFWGTHAFTRAELRPAIDDLKATPFRTFTDNFLRINVTPGDVDWFSSDSIVVNNARQAARIAKEGGCVGIMLDTEPYNALLWNPGKASTRPWNETAPRVRAWGRAVMNAIQSEYPDPILLLTLGQSFAWHEVTLLRKPIDQCPNGLLAPFIEGLFDAARGGAQIVDGHELSYGFRDTSLFRRAASTMRNGVIPIVGDSVRYRAHARVAFGVWMDHEWKKNGWDTLDVQRNYYSPQALERTLTVALRTTDRYVWLYSEEPRWWTTAGHPTALPAAYVDAVMRARRAVGLP
jgi:hypothetical protein